MGRGHLPARGVKPGGEARRRGQETGASCTLHGMAPRPLRASCIVRLWTSGCSVAVRKMACSRALDARDMSAPAAAAHSPSWNELTPWPKRAHACTCTRTLPLRQR